MDVFVAGSTGALGLPTVRALRDAGHEVTGLTRSEDKASVLRDAGASVAVADVFDASALKDAVSQARPEVVVATLNALPKEGPRSYTDLDGTNRLRVEGIANLVEAARAAGARRIVAENFIGTYGYRWGERVITEEDPIVRTVGDPHFDPALAAMASLEDQVFGSELEGIVLRIAAFYGPEVGSTVATADMVRKRRLPIIGGGQGRFPWIYIDDAARAIVAAVERGRPGEAYTIADDASVTMADYWTYGAQALGARRPLRIPSWLGRLAGSYITKVLDASLVVSNSKAKRELGWEPEVPTYREGWDRIAKSLRTA